MKKSILVLGIAALLFSCNNAGNTAESKTAYVDSTKLLKEYEEVKDLESKFKIKSEEKGKSLEADLAKFQSEVEDFQKNAAQKGQAWAQQRAGQLQQKEQELQYQRQAIMQELQAESGEQMNAVLDKVKEQIQAYAKSNNLDFVLNTEDASTVIYGKAEFDITEKVLQELNSKYNGTTSAAKVDEVTPSKEAPAAN